VARRRERTAECGREEVVMGGLPPAQIDAHPLPGGGGRGRDSRDAGERASRGSRRAVAVGALVRGAAAREAIV
jgi:hypothetical protein